MSGCDSTVPPYTTMDQASISEVDATTGPHNSMLCPVNEDNEEEAVHVSPSTSCTRKSMDLPSPPQVITVPVNSVKIKSVLNRPQKYTEETCTQSSIASTSFHSKQAGNIGEGFVPNTNHDTSRHTSKPRHPVMYDSHQCTMLRDAPSCVDFLARCQQRSNVAVHATWGTSQVRTRDTHPLFIGFSLALEGNVVIPTHILEHSTVLPAIRRFFESNVRKFVWDGRVLGDYCYYKLRAMLENAFDVCLCIAQTGDYEDPDRGRAERGVLRLPVLSEYIQLVMSPRINIVSITHMLLLLGQQQLLEASQDILRTIPRMSKAMTQVLVPKLERTYGCNEINWLLPLGIINPEEAEERIESDNATTSSSKLQVCSNCQRSFRAECFSIRYVNKCRVCLEFALPCAQEKALGDCGDLMCPYTHYHRERIIGDGTSHTVSNNIVPSSSSTTSRQGISVTRYSQQSSQQHEQQQLLSQPAPPLQSHVKYHGVSSHIQATSFQQHVQVDRPVSPISQPNTGKPSGIQVHDDYSSGSSIGKSTKPNGSGESGLPLFGHDGKSLPKIYLVRNAPTPCHFYFEGGCHFGQNCSMSHEPVPVYVPIPIPVMCTTPQQVTSFQPCKHFREGYCRKGQSCQYQHLPDEVLSSEAIPWGRLQR